MNFFEKISVFPFYPVKFRLLFPFPPFLLPAFYYFNYNFYFFPFLSIEIRPHPPDENVFFAFLPFPFITARSFSMGSSNRLFDPNQQAQERLSVERNQGIQIRFFAGNASVGGQ